MLIRRAEIDELNRIMENYYVMSDYPGQVESGAGWVKDVYPTREMIEKAIKENTYYLVEIEGRVAAGMILNEEYTDGYEKAHWLVEAIPGEFLSIHALGVMPDYRGRGLAKALVHHSIEVAHEKKYKAIRIDVLDVNEAGKKLYPAKGFQLADFIELYYEDTGLTDYYMYEYVIGG